MVPIRVQPLYSMASSIAHDHVCQKTISIPSFYLLNVKKKIWAWGHQDLTYVPLVTRALRGSLKLCQECGSDSCVRVFFIPWGSRGQKRVKWRHKGHMGEMRDSDWSRPNLLRSDWLPTEVASLTTCFTELYLFYCLLVVPLAIFIAAPVVSSRT